MIINDTYVLKTDNANLPLTTAEVNAHLKESFSDISTEDLIPILIKAVEKFGEDYTRRVFLNKTFTNYRIGYFVDCNYRVMFELKKAKLQSVSSVKYIDEDEAEQTIDSSNYSTTFSDEYSTLYFVDNYSFPTLSTQNPQPFRIEFIAGYGDTESSIPKDIKTAMLNHLAMLWKHRGDCMNVGDVEMINSWLENLLPPSSSLIYSMNRISDIRI